MSATPSSRPSAERNIYFYRIDGGADASGVPRRVDVEKALSLVKALPFKADGGRYIEQDDGSLHCIWVEKEKLAARLQFGTIRRNALPQAESLGNLKNLQLAEDEGLCEISHMCIFSDGIVGAEFNFYGPRASRFAPYIMELAPNASGAFRLEPIMRSDAAAKLLHKNGVRKLGLRIRRPYIEVIKEVDGTLGSAFDAAAKGSDADTIGIFWGPEPYKRVNLGENILTFVKNLVQRQDLQENAEEFKAWLVDERTGKADEVNLLEDQLIRKKTILRINERSRVLDSDSAYSRIEEAFGELRDALLSAPSATVTE
ncbi:hypothetical protein [Actinoplanes missouriensis]|uniref:hypothetical protein n=1 Tax=Actinoplanes missouriensis TaxID=1866 RepID=UPI00369D6E76